ncbi:hypothetical protein [Psychromicrobium lacuslunae]|uniref:hypothetical protein n=1 Tax=Psychromicrobium lacuslunae TaxID=1618207 RepID=UPI0012FF4EDE|nr:hypothetical protein [Psychromicrobium lacuslunae]
MDGTEMAVLPDQAMLRPAKIPVPMRRDVPPAMVSTVAVLDPNAPAASGTGMAGREANNRAKVKPEVAKPVMVKPEAANLVMASAAISIPKTGNPLTDATVMIHRDLKGATDLIDQVQIDVQIDARTLRARTDPPASGGSLGAEDRARATALNGPTVIVLLATPARIDLSMANAGPRGKTVKTVKTGLIVKTTHIVATVATKPAGAVNGGSIRTATRTAMRMATGGSPRPMIADRSTILAQSKGTGPRPQRRCTIRVTCAAPIVPSGSARQISKRALPVRS